MTTKRISSIAPTERTDSEKEMCQELKKQRKKSIIKTKLFCVANDYYPLSISDRAQTK